MKLLILLRSLLFSLILFPVVTAILSSLAIIGTLLTGTQTWMNIITDIWVSFALWGLCVKLKVQGLEHVPKGGCLFLFNHTSFVDIFALSKIVYGVRFGAKIELFSIPIFGQAIKAAGMLPIARQDRASAIKVLEDAEDRARRGEKFALSPEGGRNSEERLLPFKSGPFIFAVRSQVPMVPVIIKGALLAWPKGQWVPRTKTWFQQVDITFLPPVSVEGKQIENKTELMNYVRMQMQPYFPG